MTNRENFLSLIRRQGYEWIPVEFVLSPHQQQVCKEQLGADDYEEYFKFPWRRVEDLRLRNHDTEKYRVYYQTPLAEGADIDIWGVGHEKSPNSMHMTYMRNPLENMETLEEIENYPYPDFAKADGSINDDDIRSLPFLQAAFIDSKDTCRGGTHAFGHHHGSKITRFNQLGDCQGNGSLQTHDTKSGFTPVLVLFMCSVGSMVCGNGINRSISQSFN